MYVDLHLHTCFSDGTYTPEELASRAKEKELSAIAITDHDSVEAAERGEAACDRLGIEFIPGVELTVVHNRQELHLLAYLFDRGHRALRSELKKTQGIRKDRIHAIVGQLNRADVPLSADAVFSLADCEAPGRPHVARALVNMGVCASVDDAFERYLKRNRPGWVSKNRLEADAAIDLIHRAGGLAVIAHPGLNVPDAVVLKLIALGLDGIECIHSKHSTQDIEHYMQMADEHGLLVTGGSDCHGMNKGQPLIGGVKLPYHFLDQLKQRTVAARLRPRRA